MGGVVLNESEKTKTILLLTKEKGIEIGGIAGSERPKRIFCLRKEAAAGGVV
jgi:hypothetical protein